MKQIFEKLYITLVCLVIAALSVAFFAMPDKSFSDKENRTLAQPPKPTADSLLSAEYTEKLGQYFADQFPLRDGFVAVKAYTERALCKTENNGIIYAKGGVLVPRADIADNRLSENLKCVSDFEKATDTNVTLAAIPRAADAFAELLPRHYHTQADRKIWDLLKTEAENNGVHSARLYDALCKSNAYYKTDHHYTTDGAYLAYDILGKALGYTAAPKSFFKKERVTEDFCGTSMRVSGFYLAKRDSISLYRYDGDLSYDITADGKKIELYDFEKLNTTDKYAVFLGGNHARVDIKKSGEGRERLLIIRDSFADSIAPFLALHFDLTLIDLRYYTDSVSSLVKTEGINKVLILESIDEIATAKNFTYLKMK